MTLTRKAAVALTALLVVIGLTGVALAAHDSAPGDPLHGLDQAMERIGIGNGGAAERAAEATSLVAQGKVAEALSHAADAVELAGHGDVGVTGEHSNPADALRNAADNVEKGNIEAESQDVRDAVAAMLREMAALFESGANGQDLSVLVSQRVSEFAASPDALDLPDTAEDAGDNAKGPPEEVPVGPPDEVPAGP